MLLLAKEEDMQDTIYRYFKLPEEARGSIIGMLESLKEKGIILSTYKIPKKLCSRISECKMELLRNSLNRKASIECMLIKILEEFKNAEIS